MDEIRNNAVYKQVLADSFGGVMYNVANHDKYDATEILAKWDSLTDGDKSAAGGVMTGAINFLKGN